MDYASAIRQQAEDLQDELKELSLWQDEMRRREEAKKKRGVHPANTDTIPPVRGTVPSLKDAVLKSSGKVSGEDPVKNAKETGNSFFQSGKFKEAIESYSKGIDLDPEGAVAHVLYGNRALCHLKLERWEEAERDASACLRLNHSNPKGYFRRAMARKQLGNLKGARTDLEAVLALSPNDASAISEIKTITYMLQLEREKAGPVVKKVVIAEVDDDEEEEERDSNEKKSNYETKTTNNGISNENETFETQKKESLQKEVHALELAREKQRRLQEAKAKEEESKLSQKRRTCARVEVVEEESVEAKTAASTSMTKMTEERATLPYVSQAESKTSPSKSTSNKRETQSIAPRTVKTSRLSKEMLKAPKSFTEFERVFTDIRGDEELRCYYVSLIPPSNLRTLFGNNMVPDILLGLLRTVKLLPGNVALNFLQGLCTVKRVEDIALFFDSSEKRVVEELLDVVSSCGASEKDMNLFRERLRVM
ncbi:putative TPR-repeat protein [Trypanosoma rangeli]|uniref:RNA polymerase II-associated protein 3 n=1 Tax=Trypanosoma rangeli TaxID=5698 RepID=A0A3R7KY85_TRYRA|nr:putative TPR-repeat protein [Trypanosoma rangeli]RNF03707.1 putative TPR-repeat protein [Trypanosoma rangeli]|eukprot:RNF03707.1 putative TPR-repeat protein [Trypanosoma rangeli]